MNSAHIPSSCRSAAVSLGCCQDQGCDVDHLQPSAFSETDFTKDLKAIDVPTLVIHGDDDQLVPIANSALLSATLLKNGTLKVYEKFSHDMCSINADVINQRAPRSSRGPSLRYGIWRSQIGQPRDELTVMTLWPNPQQAITASDRG